MVSRRLIIYGNWSAYDELSDGVPLTEDLAMQQFVELLRLRTLGVQIDAYLMDAFWFDPAGGYRTWRKPNWPNGPQRWLDACREHNVIPGLWFSMNTLCHIELAPAWADSADENKWGLCCFEGSFLKDYLCVLDYWFDQGIRIFKFDFADFGAATPDTKKSTQGSEIQRKNIDSVREALTLFRSRHPEAILMAFNGFESKEYMNRTDRPFEQVLDLRWLEVFDSIYSGDPRPADVPTIPMWRSIDIYGDHATRLLEFNGVPLAKIDNCGFMAGPTGTCYWRGKSMWRGMLILTLARGGDLTVLYGDLGLFSDEDARWMAALISFFGDAFNKGPASSFGGIPGEGQPYGWMVGDEICVVVNPQPVIGVMAIPDANWQLLFADAGFKPCLSDDTIALGPYQMALLALDGPDLGVQEDCISQPCKFVRQRVIEQSAQKLVVEVDPDDLRILVQQRKPNGALVRNFPGPHPANSVLSIVASQGGNALKSKSEQDRVIWSGMSWASDSVLAEGTVPVRLEITTTDPEVTHLDLQVWHPKSN